MIRKLTVAALLAILLAVGAFAQDAKTVITNTTQAMGAQNLTSVTYSGSASDVNFLQTKSISGPWPLRPITNYARAIDLNQMALRSSGQTNNPGTFRRTRCSWQLQSKHRCKRHLMDGAAGLLGHAVGLPQGSRREQCNCAYAENKRKELHRGDVVAFNQGAVWYRLHGQWVYQRSEHDRPRRNMG